MNATKHEPVINSDLRLLQVCPIKFVDEVIAELLFRSVPEHCKELPNSFFGNGFRFRVGY